jgi:hypothetical protein
MSPDCPGGVLIAQGFAPLPRTMGSTGSRLAQQRERGRDVRLSKEDGIIKYGIAWLLGVPLSVLVVIFLLSRAC